MDENPVQLKTQMDMNVIIERCFEELVKAGVAKVSDVPKGSIIILDKPAAALHIQKTLIGELLEFEMIRRISPIFREFPRLESDLLYIKAKMEEKAPFKVGKK